MEATTTGAVWEELIHTNLAHNNAFYNGDPELHAWIHDDEVTLHGGFDISVKGWDAVKTGLSWAASRLSGGEITFTPLGGQIVGDLAYLVGREEGTVRVDGGERRPMALRVTMILRYVDGHWLCTHRHGEMIR